MDLAEERFLARVALLLLEARFAQHGFDVGDELGPVSFQRITGAGANQRLEHPAIRQSQVDPVRQLSNCRKSPSGARRDDRIDGAASHVAHGAKPEANAGRSHDGELVARLVDVGWEDLKPRSRASLMYCTTVSVSPISEDRSAAMNSAG
jgi:hypothetical protein